MWLELFYELGCDNGYNGGKCVCFSFKEALEDLSNLGVDIFSKKRGGEFVVGFQNVGKKSFEKVTKRLLENYFLPHRFQCSGKYKRFVKRTINKYDESTKFPFFPFFENNIERD